MSALDLRARVVLAEARALGLELDDLIAAAGAATRIPAVKDYVRTVEATFTPTTARTYRPYWSLAATMLGHRRLVDIELADLAAVVDAAVARAVASRPDSTGRASRETCVAALRALFARAVGVGLLSVNPAAALTKPRRARSRRRALDELELAARGKVADGA